MDQPPRVEGGPIYVPDNLTGVPVRPAASSRTCASCDGFVQRTGGEDGVDAISDSVIAFGKSRDPDFGFGFVNADKFMCVSFGLPGYEDDPDVLKAKRQAAAMSPD
jgi:hypothetical protein